MASSSYLKELDVFNRAVFFFFGPSAHVRFFVLCSIEGNEFNNIECFGQFKRQNLEKHAF